MQHARHDGELPGVALDGRIYGDLVKVLQLELRSLCTRNGVIGEACCRPLEVDVVRRLGLCGLTRLATVCAGRRLRGLHG